MNAMNRMVTALLAVVLLAWVPAAYAQDNGTEFGIADDLTVLGTGGTMMDPDVEIKGFSLFGSTGPAQTVNIPQAPGNVYVSGHMQVSSGAYIIGNSTFATGAYFTGVSSFSNVGNIHIAGGTANQVLKKVAGGGMVWGDDNTGLTSLGSDYRLQMVLSGGLVDSLFQQNAGGTAITMINGSSLTVTGAFGADGAVSLGNTLGVTGAATLSDALTVQGLTSLNGNVGLGNDVGDLVTINGQSSFVAGSTFTAGAYFQSVSSFSNVANVHFGGGTAGQVLSKVAGGGMQWSNVGDMVSGDNLGSHIATTTLQMANHEIMNAGHITASSATLTETLDVAGNVDLNAKLNVAGASTFVSSMTARGDTQLGDLAGTDKVAVNMATGDVRANAALTVDGGASGYAAKFYSGASLAAWIKKK